MIPWSLRHRLLHSHARTRKTFTRRALSTRAKSVLEALDFPKSEGSEIPGVYNGVWGGNGDISESVCPATGEVLARVRTVRIFQASQLHNYIRMPINCTWLQASAKEVQTSLGKTREAFLEFRKVPAPRRGEILRQIREALSRKVRSI
jgi:aldehyde dehydrogenase family 7 member A1